MHSPDDPYGLIIDSWNAFYPQKPETPELGKLKEQGELFDKLHLPYLSSIFFSYNDFRVLRASSQASAFFGKNMEEIIAMGAPGILQAINADQQRKALSNIVAIAEIMAKATPGDLRVSVSNYVNIRLKDANGQLARRALFQIFPIHFAANGQPVLGMVLVHDIGAFMHPDTWWCRYKVGSQIRYYNPESGNLSSSDILSSREMEILKMVKMGMSSKQVANHLCVSKNTVENHRRNMLRKTGAVDTSALLHIAQLTQLLP